MYKRRQHHYDGGCRISPYQEGQPFTIIPEVQGNNVDAAKTEAVIKAAAASGQSQVNLVENGCYYTVQVTKDNEQLKALCDKMNQSKDMVITYNFGENKEELTGAVVHQLVHRFRGRTDSG